jgi:hemerythrin
MKGEHNMSLLWSESLASGSSEIDSQHKELINRVNSLLNALDNGNVERQEVSKIVQFLTDYVVFHFGTEEKQMEKYSYSSTSQHKAQHQQFVKGFLKLKDRLLMEGINGKLTEDVKCLVVDWLVNHIKYSDRALGMFLKLKA